MIGIQAVQRFSDGEAIPHPIVPPETSWPALVVGNFVCPIYNIQSKISFVFLTDALNDGLRWWWNPSLHLVSATGEVLAEIPLKITPLECTNGPSTGQCLFAWSGTGQLSGTNAAASTIDVYYVSGVNSILLATYALAPIEAYNVHALRCRS